MARDYTYRTRRRKKKRKPPPAWIWSVIGLLIGLFVAFLVYLQMRPAATEQDPSPAQIEMPRERDTRDVRKKQVTPIPPPKPRFDFYNLLPEMEVIVPEQELANTAVQTAKKETQESGVYLLQVGSFKQLKQADQLRVKLTLLGLETKIQTVKINDREKWHRVRVGPFPNLSSLNKARTGLDKKGISAIPIQLRE